MSMSSCLGCACAVVLKLCVFSPCNLSLSWVATQSVGLLFANLAHRFVPCAKNPHSEILRKRSYKDPDAEILREILHKRSW